MVAKKFKKFVDKRSLLDGEDGSEETKEMDGSYQGLQTGLNGDLENAGSFLIPPIQPVVVSAKTNDDTELSIPNYDS